MTKGLPSPTPGAADVAKLTTGIGAALAALWYPEAALAAPFLPYAIDKFIERPKTLLIETLKNGRLEVLSTEQAAEFVPMAYRFMEAAKQGEYEHTQKMLAAFIAGELGEKTPEATNFARMARRLEGLSFEEIRTIARVSKHQKGSGLPRQDHTFVLKDICGQPQINPGESMPDLRDHVQTAQCLNELSTRGLVITAWEAGYGGGGGPRYALTDSFWELVDKAGLAVLRDGAPKADAQ